MTMNDYSKLQYHMQDLLADYDFVLLDSPNDLYNLEEVLDTSNEAIIVHSPDYSSKIIVDASELLSKHKITNLGIVLNKSQEDSVNDIFNIPVIAKVPDHKHIRASFRLKHPVLHTHPKSIASKQFLMLAKKLVV
jgi:septum site-determining protein MinD